MTRTTNSSFYEGAKCHGAVVRWGTWLYAAEVECDVRIVCRPIFYGSGDPYDPAEFAEDRAGPAYDLEFGSTTQRGVFVAGGGAYASLDAATAAASLYGVVWLAERV